MLRQLELSFEKYKIDYSHQVGSGVYGSVYRLVERPEKERGWLSSSIPYIYDRIFYINSNEVVQSSYCVKISKPSIQIFFENIHAGANVIPFVVPGYFAVNSFFILDKEKELNVLLKNNELTTIDFFPKSDFYAQFKTFIQGKSLSFYIENNFFSDPASFQLRKDFVEFLRALKNLPRVINDFHGDNLIYDENKLCWEVVDGGVSDISCEKDKLILNYIKDFTSDSGNAQANNLIQELANFANDSTDQYTKNIDEDLISNKSLTEIFTSLNQDILESALTKAIAEFSRRKIKIFSLFSDVKKSVDALMRKISLNNANNLPLFLYQILTTDIKEIDKNVDCDSLSGRTIFALLNSDYVVKNFIQQLENYLSLELTLEEVERAIQEYKNYKEDSFLGCRWIFSSEESFKTTLYMKNSNISDRRRFQEASAYIRQCSEHEFAKILMQIVNIKIKNQLKQASHLKITTSY